jgi:hypothetical protein
MIESDNRMSAADLLKIVGTNQPEIPDGSTLLQRLFFQGAPFAKPHYAGRPLKAEDKVSAELAVLMREAMRDGRFVGLCSHVANESGDQSTKLARLRSQKKKVMGMLSGAPDWWFGWVLPAGGRDFGVIELKRPGVLQGSLSDSQAMVRDWCQEIGIPWACHNRSDRAFEQLQAWGAIR